MILSGCQNNTEPFVVFEIEDFEITIYDDVFWSNVKRENALFYGVDYFYFPIYITNISERIRVFNGFYFHHFAPSRMEMTAFSFLFYSETISESRVIRPKESVRTYANILFEGDGVYTFIFTNWENDDFYEEFSFDIIAPDDVEYQQKDNINSHFVDYDVLKMMNFDEFELTIFDSISFEIVEDDWQIDLNGRAMFYIPVSIVNKSDRVRCFRCSNNLRFYGPDGIELNTLAWSNINDARTVEGVLPDNRIDTYFRILFDNEGEYIIGFSNSYGDVSEFYFNVLLDGFEMPEIYEVNQQYRKIYLGEPFVFNNLEITLYDDISFATSEYEWHYLYNQTLFSLPIRVVNVDVLSRTFNNCEFVAMNENEEKLSTLVNIPYIRPNATLESYVYILFDGDGRYKIEFLDWNNDKIIVIFDEAK